MDAPFALHTIHHGGGGLEKKDNKKTEKKIIIDSDTIQKIIVGQLVKDKSFISDMVRSVVVGLVEGGLFRQINTIEVEYIADSFSIKSKIQMK